MSDINRDPNAPENREPQIAVNPHDGVVAVEEADRTVLLTPNETIIVEKQPEYDIAPANRPKKVYAGMWGPAEIGVVGVASLAVLAALATYFFFTLPAKRELEQNRATRDRLEAELASARTKYGDITNVETHVAKLVTSANDFEAMYLPVAANGNTALYQKLNGLISGYGLINTSGPDYAPLDIAQPGDTDNTEQRGRSRFRSLFPGTYVTMTLEGPYANLRRFIREIETGNDFIIISSVELEPSENQSEPARSERVEQPQMSDDSGFPPLGPMGSGPSQVRRPTGRTHGQVVSLRMEMAAYFRRPMMEAPATTSPQGQ